MITLNGNNLTLEEVIRVARDGEEASLAGEARQRVEASRRRIDLIVEYGQVVYGVNTGFGRLADVRIPADQLRQLQSNLVRSHSSGVGPPLATEQVRAMLLLRANVLAKGFSGVRPIVIDTLIAMLNAGVHPVIPSRGSVGASGDLAPLAHLALAAMGEGEVEYDRKKVGAAEALGAAGIAPLTLEAKEGLALLNGTQAICSLLAMAVARAEHLAHAADVVGAMSLEALRGTATAFRPEVHAMRPHPGQIEVARHLTELLAESEIAESHRSAEKDPRVQDAYSLRCMPQVHGAVRDTIAHVRRVLEIEINSATDNPLVLETGEVVSAGNFHGEPVAMAADFLAIVLCELASISERRIERLVNADLSDGLPMFLAKTPGIESGLMMAQITAASLVSENKVYAHPASVDTIPTDANREDHVSMGMAAALKLEQILENVESVLAIELFTAAQGLEFLKPLRPARKVEEARQKLRARVPAPSGDVPLAPLFAASREVLREL